MKTYQKAISLVVAAILVIVALLYLNHEKISQHSVGGNVKTYKNVRYGFEVNYPDRFTLDESRGQEVPAHIYLKDHSELANPIELDIQVDTLSNQKVGFIPPEKIKEEYYDEIGKDTYIRYSLANDTYIISLSNCPAALKTVCDGIVHSLIFNQSPKTDQMLMSANNAAAEVKTQTQIKITHFLVENGVAYVVLNIDTDGWAGVSNTLSQVRPLIQSALLKYPEIKSVVFGSEAITKFGLTI